MKEYIPNPVDTGHIQLPKELEYLVEEMAKNVHEVWSKTRIEQGWTYGKKRDDVLKQHPCLVPYEELKEYNILPEAFDPRVADVVSRAVKELI